MVRMQVQRRNWLRRAAVILIGIMCLWDYAAAQNISVQASVNATTVGTEDRIIYSLEIQGASFSDVKTPSPPATENLVLLQSVPGTQSNVSIINGRIQQSVVFRWTYRPTRQGSAQIGAARIEVNGAVLSTEAIRLTVMPGSQTARQRGRPSPGLFPPSPQSGQAEAASPEPDSRDMFIRAIPSKRTAYQNEQITVEYQLFFREGIHLRQSRLADSWDAEGFWREDLDVDPRPIPRVEVVNGLRYNTIVLKRIAAFATRSGSLQIDPLRIETEAVVPVRSSDPFEQLFSMQRRATPVELSSPAVTLQVLPMPDDAPPSFKGAVGAFRMDAQTLETEVEVGEPVELKVHITGSGNIATLEPPPFEAPGVFEKYDPQVETVIDRSGRQVIGSKTFTYLLVPRSNGTFELPAAAFTYFDPEAQRYVSLRGESATIRVTGTVLTTPATSSTTSGLPVDDIADVIPADGAWVNLKRPPLYAVPWAYLALLLPLFAVAGALAYHRYAARLATDVGYARNRRAHPVARKHLKQAESLLKENSPRRFYEEVERALLGFIGNRLNIAETGLTRPQLQQQLISVGVANDARNDLQSLLEACDQGRFSPRLPDQAEMNSALDQASTLIVLLDRQLDRQTSAPATV